MTKFCKNCGHELDDGSLFCNECGTKIGETKSYSNQFSGDNPFYIYKIDMIDGENIIRSSQIHVGCLYLPLAVVLFGFIFGFLWGLVTYGYGFLAMIPIMIVGVVWTVIRYIGYKSNDLILTNKRVFGKCGLISTTHLQTPLNRIDAVSFSNGLFGKLIGYGTVEIATSSSHFKFRFIRDGQTFYNDIFNQLESSEEEKRMSNAKAIVDAMEEKLS